MKEVASYPWSGWDMIKVTKEDVRNVDKDWIKLLDEEAQKPELTD